MNTSPILFTSTLFTLAGPKAVSARPSLALRRDKAHIMCASPNGAMPSPCFENRRHDVLRTQRNFALKYLVIDYLRLQSTVSDFKFRSALAVVYECTAVVHKQRQSPGRQKPELDKLLSLCARRLSQGCCENLKHLIPVRRVNGCSD